MERLALTEEIADAICTRLAEGQSLRSICCDDDMPAASTVYGWLLREENAWFVEQYTRAREMQADYLVDEILDIADDGSNDWMERRDEEGGNVGWKENGEALRRSQLRVDSRKWMAGKLRPKKYGDATTLKHADADGGPLNLAALIGERRKRAQEER
jgi:hypothetical protein